jgi:hypothetical protein
MGPDAIQNQELLCWRDQQQFNQSLDNVRQLWLCMHVGLGLASGL